MQNFFICLACVTIVILWRLLMSIGTYFLTKSDAIIDEVNRRDLKEPEVKIKNTIELMSLIRTMIENETMDILKKPIQLNEPYQTMNIDDDSKKIATKVYNAIDKEILSTYREMGNQPVLLVITPEYLQKYIIQESISVFLSAVTAHNSTVRQGTLVELPK